METWLSDRKPPSVKKDLSVPQHLELTNICNMFTGGRERNPLPIGQSSRNLHGFHRNSFARALTSMAYKLG